MNRRTVLVVVATLLPIALLGAGWLALGSHAILPGFKGCELVRDDGARQRCYSKRLAALVDKVGVRGAMREVNRRSPASARLQAACHLAWHDVGRKDGSSSARAGKELRGLPGSTFCDQGYSHGYIVAWLERTKASLDPDRSQKVCLDTYDTRDDRKTCFHAFGHAYARESARSPRSGEGRCFEMAPEESVEYAVQYYMDCVYGMWMEYTFADIRAKRNSPVNNCRRVARRALVSCYQFLPARRQLITGTDEPQIDTCERYPPDEELQSMCANWFNVQSKGRADCHDLKDRFLVAACIEGAKGTRPPFAMVTLQDMLYPLNSRD